MGWGTRFEKQVTEALEMQEAKQLVSAFPLGGKIRKVNIYYGGNSRSTLYKGSFLTEQQSPWESFMLSWRHEWYMALASIQSRSGNKSSGRVFLFLYSTSCWSYKVFLEICRNGKLAKCYTSNRRTKSNSDVISRCFCGYTSPFQRLIDVYFWDVV